MERKGKEQKEMGGGRVEVMGEGKGGQGIGTYKHFIMACPPDAQESSAWVVKVFLNCPQTPNNI